MSGDGALLGFVLDASSWACLVVGSIFSVIGGIGMVRMPDFYTRGHAAGITDTLGAGLILVGLMFQAGLTLVAAKLVMVLFFLYITSPTSTHALFKSAYAGGVRWELEREKHHADSRDESDGPDGGLDVSV